MKMFVFPNGKDFTPQAWVGRDVVMYFTVYVDILNAFDNFGPLYDEIIGEKGIWDQTLESMKKDPSGPQIDLRQGTYRQPRAAGDHGCHYNLPITTTSERLLWAIETKDPAAVAKAMEKCVKNDPTIKKRMIGGHVVWEIVEEEDTGMPQLKVDVPYAHAQEGRGQGQSRRERRGPGEGEPLPAPRGDHRRPRGAARGFAH